VRGPRDHACTIGATWWCYLELADLEGGHDQPPGDALWTRGLLIRRHVGDGEFAFFSTWCRKGTPMATLVGVEGHRWCIEDSFETAENELGLDHNETRSWHGWDRHTALVMLAFAMMAAIRRRANIATRLARRRIQPADVIAWSQWRRAHQADARTAHMRRNAQRNARAGPAHTSFFASRHHRR